MMSGFLCSFRERLGVRGVCGGREGACCEGCWVCQGLRSVTAAPARLGCAVYGFPVRPY